MEEVSSKSKSKKSELYRKYYLKNREKKLEYVKQYHIKNRDKRIEYFREYHKRNHDKYIEYSRQYNLRVKEYKKGRGHVHVSDSEESEIDEVQERPLSPEV